MPKFVCDVTVPVCYALDPVKNAEGLAGLVLSGCKQSIVGFFNPIPDCLPIDHRNPTLCIVYRAQIVTADAKEKASEISIKYFDEKTAVSILV